MATVADFRIDDLEGFSRDLRELGREAPDMTAVATEIGRYLYENLRTPDGTPEAMVVLVNKTHPFERLPPHLQDAARQADESVTRTTPCLVRLAMVGFDDPDPKPESLVQPLTATALHSQPVLEVLFGVMGVDLDLALDPLEAIRARLHHRDLNFFLVPDVPTSEHFQDDEARVQIEALGIRSLLGIGGALPTGDLFFVFLFTTTPVSEASAELMRSLAPAIKASLIPHTLRPFPPTR